MGITDLTTFRMLIGDETVYDGPAIAVPRVGEDIHHDGEVVRIESVVWNFGGPDGVTSVVLGVGTRPYTF